LLIAQLQPQHLLRGSWSVESAASALSLAAHSIAPPTRRERHSPFVPGAASCTAANGIFNRSPRRRGREMTAIKSAQGVRDLHIDNQFGLRRLLNRRVGRFRTQVRLRAIQTAFCLLAALESCAPSRECRTLCASGR